MASVVPVVEDDGSLISGYRQTLKVLLRVCVTGGTGSE